MTLDSFLQGLSNVFNTFGSAVFVPVIIFVICLILGTGLRKGFFSGVYAGIGLTGFGWLTSQYIPIIVPAVQNLVKSTGLNLPVVDIGWQATSVIAYATKAGMVFLGVGLLFQVILFLIKWTNVFIPGDLWNNYSYMAWGSMIFVITKDMWLALATMLVMVLYNVIFIELNSKRWSTYYGYPNCTIPALHICPGTVTAIGGNWLLNKMGAYKIRWRPDSLQKRMGFLGEPIVLGLILGLLIGVLGHIRDLNVLASWGNIATIAISTSAVMAIFPRVANIFASAFMPITEAARKRSTKNVQTGNEFFIGVNDATGYGEPATLISGILLIPIMLLLCAILPGNKTLLLVDLIAISFIIQPMVAASNGNIFKTVIVSAIEFSIGLYICTWTAPIFTQVYSQFATTPLAPGALVTAGMILNKPIVGGLIFLPALNFKWLAIVILLVVYFPLYFLFKKNKVRIQDWMEAQAALDVESEEEEEPVLAPAPQG
jgi:galactitol PTS system EIIC component